MLTNAIVEYQNFLESLVELLDITPAQFQKARDHYTAVGDWLSKEDSSLYKYDPEIYPQGSFRLGTVIKPITGEDEFDIDLVCKLQLTTDETTQENLKKIIGDRLKDNADYERMLQKEEGRRCWTLDYQETPKFHMDILPSIKDDFNWLLENRVSYDYARNAICITDKESEEYTTLSNNWNKSNPIGYANWFKEQMKAQLLEGKKLLSKHKNVAVEDIREDEVKTPLQRAVQILKRHRDIMYSDDKDKPISIIITTLAARAYSEEDNIYRALKNILDKMHTFIRDVNGVSVVENPVNPLENFADKWVEHPQREENFRYWMKKAKEDIYELIERNGFESSIDNLREVFGKRMVNEALNKSGLQNLSESSSISSVNRNQLSAVPHKQQPIWNISLTKSVSIAARYKDNDGWHTITPSTLVPKHKKLMFVARTNVKKPYSVYWQVVNTGQEAKKAEQLRGEIFLAKTAGKGGLRHKEETRYNGTHWVECFIVKGNECVARSNEFFIRIT